MPINDEEWADLVAHEIPPNDDAVIEKYLSSRAALIAEEKKHRSDHSFCQALSPIAKRACDIITKIAQQEKALPEAASHQSDSLEGPKSFNILRNLPKGALLNAHLHSLIDIPNLVNLVLSNEGVYISSPQSLDPNLATSKVPIHLQFRNAPSPNGGNATSSIWASSYEPNTPTTLTEAVRSFPTSGEKEGGRAGFIEWLSDHLFQPPSLQPSGGSDDRRDSAESPLSRLIYYEPIFRGILQQIMASLVENNISWAEIRFTFPLGFHRNLSETPETDYDLLFSIIHHELAKFRAALGPDQTFWGLRVIWSTSPDSCASQRTLIENLDDCIATKIAWPDLIAGYDAGPALSASHLYAHILPSLFWLRKQSALEDVQLPLLLTCPPAPNIGSSSSSLLFDCLLLGVRSISLSDADEGFFGLLQQHARFLEGVKDKKILITSSSGSPALESLTARGISCALSPEPRSGDLTRPYWDALRVAHGIDAAGLAALAENSVRWSAFEDKDSGQWTKEIREASVGGGIKAERLRRWAVEWERFSLGVVDEFGEEEEEEGTM